MSRIQDALKQVDDAKEMLAIANDELMSVVISCQDMPLKQAMADGIVRFNFAVPRGFKRDFTGLPDLHDADVEYAHKR